WAPHVRGVIEDVAFLFAIQVVEDMAASDEQPPIGQEGVAATEHVRVGIVDRAEGVRRRVPEVRVRAEQAVDSLPCQYLAVWEYAGVNGDARRRLAVGNAPIEHHGPLADDRGVTLRGPRHRQ